MFVENFNPDTGAEVALRKAKDEVWKMLGFRLADLANANGIRPLCTGLVTLAMEDGIPNAFKFLREDPRRVLHVVAGEHQLRWTLLDAPPEPAPLPKDSDRG